MNGVGDDVIDLDRPHTWPEATRRWAEQHAARLAGSTEFLADLAIPLELEDEFRQTFGPRKVLAYHCTRLLSHEADAISADGLRLLDKQLPPVEGSLWCLPGRRVSATLRVRHDLGASSESLIAPRATTQTSKVLRTGDP